MPSPSALNRNGLLAGVGAYILWGFLPLFFPLLEPASPLEISAHRVVWTALVCAALLAATRGLGSLRALLSNRRQMGWLALCSALLAANWLIFLVGVLTGRIVEASLGYFITPIFTVLLAVLVLGEKVRRAHWGAIGIATLGLIVIAVENGTVPWIAFGLALSFGLYGLIKKRLAVGIPAIAGLTAETLVLTPIAIGYLAVLAILGTGTFAVATGVTGTASGHILLLMSAGVVTAVPLLLFNSATRRLPLVTVGTLQFIGPIMQFTIGVTIVKEEMSAGRWIGFAGVWLALIILTLDAVRESRSLPRIATDPAPFAGGPADSGAADTA